MSEITKKLAKKRLDVSSLWLSRKLSTKMRLASTTSLCI